MPNWCVTKCVIRGPEPDIEKMKTTCFILKPEDDYSGIDFQRVLPMPEILVGTRSPISEWGLIALGQNDAAAQAMCQAEAKRNPYAKYTDIDGLTQSVLERAWVKEKGVTDIDGLKELLLKQDPDCLEDARKNLAANEATGYYNWYDWCIDNWGTKWPPMETRYQFEGAHTLWMGTAWTPPIPVLVKVIEMFPTLSFTDIKISEDNGAFFYKGTISAAGVDLVEDKEAEVEYEAFMYDLELMEEDKEAAAEEAAFINGPEPDPSVIDLADPSDIEEEEEILPNYNQTEENAR